MASEDTTEDVLSEKRKISMRLSRPWDELRDLPNEIESDELDDDVERRVRDAVRSAFAHIHHAKHVVKGDDPIPDEAVTSEAVHDEFQPTTSDTIEIAEIKDGIRDLDLDSFDDVVEDADVREVHVDNLEGGLLYHSTYDTLSRVIRANEQNVITEILESSEYDDAYKEGEEISHFISIDWSNFVFQPE